jgi:hypothetical protein
MECSRDRKDVGGVDQRFVYDRLSHLTRTIANHVDGLIPTSASADDDLTVTLVANVLGELTGLCTGAQNQIGGCDPTSGTEDQAWHWTYDDMGRQIAEIPPVNESGTPLNTSAWVYEPGGRLDMTCSYPAGGSCSGTTNTHKTDLTYDKAGRPKTEATSANGSLAITVTTAYGLHGQPLTIGDGTDTLTSVYDPYGRLDQLKRSSTVLTDYAYNADGTIASRIDGTLAATSFGYDWAKRPISTTLSSTIYAGNPLTSSYRLDGLLDRVTLPTGPQSYTLGYDAARRPITLTLQSGGSLSQAYG